MSAPLRQIEVVAGPVDDAAAAEDRQKKPHAGDVAAKRRREASRSE